MAMKTQESSFLMGWGGSTAIVAILCVATAADAPCTWLFRELWNRFAKTGKKGNM